jgi:hypothetical protein
MPVPILCVFCTHNTHEICIQQLQVVGVQFRSPPSCQATAPARDRSHRISVHHRPNSVAVRFSGHKKTWTEDQPNAQARGPGPRSCGRTRPGWAQLEPPAGPTAGGRAARADELLTYRSKSSSALRTLSRLGSGAPASSRRPSCCQVTTPARDRDSSPSPTEHRRGKLQHPQASTRIP